MLFRSDTKFKVPVTDAPNVAGARDLGFQVAAGNDGEPDLVSLRTAIESGRIKALYVLDPGPAGSLGDVAWLVAARRAGRVPFLVVQSTTMTELAAEADVVLARAHRDEAEYRDALDVVRRSAGRLSRIVDDLFLLARADAGHLVVRDDAVYLDEVVHDAVRAMEPVAAGRDVAVRIAAMDQATVRGDAELLGRVLLNLLDNAVKHSPAGASVTVEMATHGRRHRVCVVDAGPGIPAADAARLFERFFRGDAARARADGSVTDGAGLGLAIARRIAEAHGGTLALVESRPGRTEFRLDLPAAG